VKAAYLSPSTQKQRINELQNYFKEVKLMENDSIPVSKQSTYRNKMQVMNISAEVNSPKNVLTQHKTPMMDTTSFGPPNQQ
jgi:hypothetical protein